METGKAESRRRVNGRTDEELEVTILPEEVNIPNARHRKSYGYTLDPFELAQAHILGAPEA